MPGLATEARLASTAALTRRPSLCAGVAGAGAKAGDGGEGREGLPTWAQRQGSGQGQGETYRAGANAGQGVEGIQGSFSDRFFYMGGKILQRTAKNAYLTAETVRMTFEKILD